MEQDNRTFLFVSYVVGSGMFLCIILMMSYPIIFVAHLWKSGENRRAAACTFRMLICSVLVAYYWFYSMEISKQMNVFSKNIYIGYVE